MICYESFVERKVYENNKWFHPPCNRMILQTVRIVHCLTCSGQWWNLLTCQLILVGMRCLWQPISSSMCQVRVYMPHYMSYNLVKGHPWMTYVHEVRLAMCTTQPVTHGKLGAIATRMGFIRHPVHPKWYVIYGENYNGGMMEMNSHSVDFLEDEFSSIWWNFIPNDMWYTGKIIMVVW